jgi:hypothetical protein
MALLPWLEPADLILRKIRLPQGSDEVIAGAALTPPRMSLH